jgi:aminotransferase in exopolysaccharide biosynthesis
MHKPLIDFIQATFQTKDFIPLHAPNFIGNEKKYVDQTITSTFVSSVGEYVDKFEQQIMAYTQASSAIATVNGTAALHTALYMAGLRAGDLVITQALTFVATCNAIHFAGAEPVFVDISPISLSLCPIALEQYLQEHCYLCDSGVTKDKKSGQVVRAIMPMHTFGHPAQLDEIAAIGKAWSIALVEDAAESLGSFYKNKHSGTIGDFAAISFNGNKIITSGGGGMVLCATEKSGKATKHLTTTAKVPHPYEYFHDQVAFNYRMPNLNAALGCAQLESLPHFLKQKRALAAHYQDFFASSDYAFVTEPDYAKSNYWLNAVICPDKKTRQQLLEQTNKNGVMTRPVWQLMHQLPMYQHCRKGALSYSALIADTLVNLPSSAITLGH